MAPTRIEIKFDPAAVLYRNKLRRRFPAEIPTELIPLPSLKWTSQVPVAERPSDRELIKNMMRMISGAWVSIVKDDPHDRGFVALIRHSSAASEFTFTVYCPHAEVLQSLSTKTGRDALVQDPTVASLEIRYKFALPETLCPVLFRWNHEARNVLVTNENQVNDPEQFLAIDRIGNTSGLLNFIGCFNLLNVMGQEEKYAKRLPGLIKDAMSTRANEWLRWVYMLAESKALFDPARICVVKPNPEVYFCDYDESPTAGQIRQAYKWENGE